MKKLIALLLALLMLFSLVACAKTDETPADTSDGAGETTGDSGETADQGGTETGGENFTIGMRFPTTIDQMQQQTIDNVTLVATTAGGELLIENAALTPEGNIETYEKLIAAGVDGLVVIPAADTVLPRVKQMCEDAQIPWAIYFRSILDEDIKAEIEASPYYLGNTYEDEYLAGYTLTQKMGEAGCKNIILFSTALGDTTGEQREAGMNAACEEYGITVVNEFRAVAQASDAAQAVESVLTTHPEVDGIFISAGTLTPGILPALTAVLDDYGRSDVKITIIDFPEGLQDALASGYVLAACGGHNVTDPMFAAALVVNAIKGTPLSDKPVSIRINQMYLESEEDIVNYFKYCESGTATYTAEELNELFFQFVNPDVTIESLTEVAENYSLDTLMERHQDIVS